MKTRDRIITYFKENNPLEGVSGSDICQNLEMSRQAVNKHIQKLLGEGLLVKEGRTKGARYRLASGEGRKKELKRRFNLKGLQEDEVFNRIAIFLNLRNELTKEAFSVLQYGFTELLNNAIDHSNSPYCNIRFSVDEVNAEFSIRDFGIGLFYSISSKFGLEDENEALGELIKGKVTTMKERHSGEGIFFSSKVGDVVTFTSHNIEVEFNNNLKDTFIKSRRKLKGTGADFRIRKSAKRKINDVFSEFAPEEYDYSFQRTKVAVKLFHSEYFSRSEAKRLVSRIDEFKEVVLDFKGVTSLGQAFADEVFRVFQNSHPILPIQVLLNLKHRRAWRCG